MADRFIQCVENFLPVQVSLVPEPFIGNIKGCFKVVLPSGWDSHSLNHHALLAKAGLLHGSISKHTILDSVDDWKTRKHVSLQGVVTKAVRATFPPGLIPLVRDRIEIHFPKALADIPHLQNSIQALGDRLRRAQPHVRSCVMKTITNAWTTSYRFHEPRLLPCLFGCESPSVYDHNGRVGPDAAPFPMLDRSCAARDDLSHYIQCPILWEIVAQGLADPSPESVVDRLCLRHHPRYCALALTIAFSLYHSLKHGHLAVVHAAIDSGDFSDVCCMARLLSRSFANEFQGSRFSAPEDPEFFSIARFPSFDELI